MKPIKVKISVDGWIGVAVWVACDRGAAVVIQPLGQVRYFPLESLEVLEDVTCDAKGSIDFGRSSGSKPPAVDGSATSPEEPNERKVGPVRKRRRKRASSPRGPRSNQWQPEKPE